MHVRSGSIAAVFSLCLALPLGSAAQAQTIHASVEDVALRSGESVIFGDVYLVGANCSSLLTSVPEVEVMDGPPGVAVAVNEAQVVPDRHGCDRSVPGGKVVITARDIDVYSYTRMVLRITYKTPNGDLQRSQHINVALFP
jgi:hypothetical protein